MILEWLLSLFTISRLPDSLPLVERNQILVERAQAPLEPKFRLISWNIHKGDDGKKWASDMARLALQHEVFLVQEMYVDGFVDRTLRDLTMHNWYFSYSFTYRGHATGVATGCRCQFESWDTLVSPGREPILNSPKVTQVATIPLKKARPLLLLNIHAINFVRQPEYEAQIDALLAIIHQHHNRGPVVFAGDFNTWNPWRYQYLKYRLIAELGMQEVMFEPDKRWPKLDRIFVKDCDISESRIHDEIRTSDHQPISVGLRCH
jgi:endonuclease/exonuclease/phosphatase (EEP) superfamily protein YafD